MKKLFLLPIVLLLSAQATFAVAPDSPIVVANESIVQRKQEFAQIILVLANCCKGMVNDISSHFFDPEYSAESDDFILNKIAGYFTSIEGFIMYYGNYRHLLDELIAGHQSFGIAVLQLQSALNAMQQDLWGSNWSNCVNSVAWYAGRIAEGVDALFIQE